MAKTKEISFNCRRAEIMPNHRDAVTVTVAEPDIEGILYEIDEDDLIDWVKQHKNPEDLFSESALEKWAESEGYIKEETKD